MIPRRGERPESSPRPMWHTSARFAFDRAESSCHVWSTVVPIISPAEVHSVIVIGSGASGGMAAWNLTQKGIDVLLLDAGDKFDRSKYWTHVQPWEAQQRAARGEKPPQFFLD